MLCQVLEFPPVVFKVAADNGFPDVCALINCVAVALALSSVVSVCSSACSMPLITSTSGDGIGHAPLVFPRRLESMIESNGLTAGPHVAISL